MMISLYQENCPLCSEPSEYEQCDRKKRQLFYCKKCKQLLITDRAKRELVGKNIRHQSLSDLSGSLTSNEILHISFEERELKCVVEDYTFWR
ncbi:hypothetical protein [Methyloradius palustris]|uniref:hypothetical protein n=1 Tax=Methyloradius palustris TaxID=2778876 RepID=UPI001C8C16B3|nr:hypothetical protein [Methyloradius palustris]